MQGAPVTGRRSHARKSGGLRFLRSISENGETNASGCDGYADAQGAAACENDSRSSCCGAVGTVEASNGTVGQNCNQGYLAKNRD